MAVKGSWKAYKPPGYTPSTPSAQPGLDQSVVLSTDLLCSLLVLVECGRMTNSRMTRIPRS